MTIRTKCTLHLWLPFNNDLGRDATTPGGNRCERNSRYNSACSGNP